MGSGTFMHQARYETDLHDAEVDLAISRVVGAGRDRPLPGPRLTARKTERRNGPGVYGSEAAGCCETWVT